MAATPKKFSQSPSKPNLRSQFSPAPTPVTPQPQPPRKSTRSKSLVFDSPKTPNLVDASRESQNQHATPKRRKTTRENQHASSLDDQSETRKRKLKRKREVGERTVTLSAKKGEKSARVQKNNIRAYYEKVVYDGGEFEVGDDVYVKRREDATSDDEDPEVEECRLCFRSGDDDDDDIMIECDHCLGGFHLKCLTPPLKDVPEGDWICGFCEASKMGKGIDFPKPPEGKKLVRTMTQKLLSSDLWAAHIESVITVPL